MTTAKITAFREIQLLETILNVSGVTAWCKKEEREAEERRDKLDGESRARILELAERYRQPRPVFRHTPPLRTVGLDDVVAALKSDLDMQPEDVAVVGVWATKAELEPIFRDMCRRIDVAISVREELALRDMREAAADEEWDDHAEARHRVDLMGEKRMEVAHLAECSPAITGFDGRASHRRMLDELPRRIQFFDAVWERAFADAKIGMVR